LDTTSDPKGTGTTTNKIVSLQGQTSAGVQVALIQNGATIGTATADSKGAFSFNNITLASGPNDYTVQATDRAGNVSQLQPFFVEENGPVAVPTAPVGETLTAANSA